MGHVSKKKGALKRVEKGKGHVYKLIGALVKVKGTLFLCKKGHFSYVKRGTFRVLEKVGALCPPFPPGRTASDINSDHYEQVLQLSPRGRQYR